jgi:hypothetical protein
MTGLSLHASPPCPQNAVLSKAGAAVVLRAAIEQEERHAAGHGPREGGA